MFIDITVRTIETGSNENRTLARISAIPHKR
jgi:hypothetical protein